MSTLRDEINDVINTEQIQGIRFLRINDWQWILDALANNFLSQGKHSLNNIWLGECIKEPYKSYTPENGLEALQSLLTPSETYWFIASDEDGKYWVLEGSGNAIVNVLSETRYFEYYITNKDISWLMCENHHGTMIIKDKL